MKKIFFWCRNVACAGLHTEVGKMIILSLIINMIIECLNHRNLWGLAELFANPVVFLYNTSIIFLTLCIGFFTTRKVFVYVMISAIWITLAVSIILLISNFGGYQFCCFVCQKNSIYSNGHISDKRCG